MVLSSSNLLPNPSTPNPFPPTIANRTGEHLPGGSRKRPPNQRVCFEETMEIIVPRDNSAFECNTELTNSTGPEQSPLLSDSFPPHSKRMGGRLHQGPVHHENSPRVRRHTYANHASTEIEQLSSSSNVVTETTGLLEMMNSSRRRSSPGHPLTDEPRSPPHSAYATQSCAVVRARGHTTAGMTEHGARSVPNSGHPLPPSLLEPIPQGQELSVSSSFTTAFVCPESAQGGLGTPSQHASKCGTNALQNCKAGRDATGISDEFHPPACCACRISYHVNWAPPNPVHPDVEHRSMNHLQKPQHSSAEEDLFDFDKTAPTKSDHSQSIHWARELIGRFRLNSVHAYSDHERSPSNASSNAGRRHSTPHSNGSSKSSDKGNTGACVPDQINPKRLPRSHGPVSAFLQFSGKPLHHQSNISLTTNSIPIPVTATRGGCGSSALKSSSWKPRKFSARVRWLSQSNSDGRDEVPSVSISGCSSIQSRLCSSALEQFRGAVDPLSAGLTHPVRIQPFAPNPLLSNRATFRVKRASESQKLLVISKSLSGSQEEPSPLSVGHFDENHVYSTLFRHSTCYDVLPDSGKLLVLDSRIGVVRAIRALLENGVYAAPVWHSATQNVIGLLSQDLALHLLASLSASVLDIPEHETQSPLPESTSKPLTGLAEGLRVWGSRQLYEVIRLLASRIDGNPALAPVTLVAPQTGLKKALNRLLHPTRPVHPPLTRQHSIDRDLPSQPMDAVDAVGGSCNHEDSMQVDEVPTVSQSLMVPPRHLTDPITPASAPQRASNMNVTPRAPLPAVSPTHLIVMDPLSGNLLGLLGVDRLLAYLRLRLDELPYCSQMMATIESIPGLLWTERHSRMAATIMKAAHRSSIDTNHGSAANGIHFPNPILFTNTSCQEALRAVATWLPQLPALPVLSPTQGATTQANFLQGFISPGDILHFVLGKSPNDAVTRPVSKILEAKMLHCRFQQEHICHTYDTVADVLDRMFRLRASCLVIMDFPLQQDTRSTPAATSIGMVTSRDLLRAILYTKSAYSPIRRRSANSQTSDSSLGFHSKCANGLPRQVSDPEPLELSLESTHQFDPQKLAHSTKSDSLLGPSRSSSGDESLSSGSTCSAAFSPTDRVYLEHAMRRSSLQPSSNACSCPCHQNDARRFSIDSHLLATSSSSAHTNSDLSHFSTSKGLELESSPSGGAHRTVGAAKGSPEAKEFSSATPGVPVTVRQSVFPSPQVATHVPKTIDRKVDRHRRGDDDESVFPMD